MARLLPFSRLLVRTVGDPTLRRLIPIYCGLAMLVAVVFGPSGMSAEQLLQGMEISPRFRIGMWIAWLVLVAGPTRLLFHNPQAVYLRAQPIAPCVHWLLLGAMALLIQAPWAWLWLRGDGAPAAITATLVAAALCTLGAVTARHWMEALVVAAVFVGITMLITMGASTLQLAPVGIVVFSAAVRAAWLRAPERGGGVDLGALSSGRLGLLVVYIAAVWRQRSSSVARGAVLTGVGGALTGLIARNNHIVSGDSVGLLALVLATIAVTMATAMVVVPVVEAERAMRWMLNATGTSAARRMLASAGVCGAAGAGYALVFVGLMMWVAPPSSTLTLFRVVATVISLGVSVGLIELRCARWAERAAGIDGVRLVSATIGVILVTAALLGVMREWAVLAAAAAALKMTLGSVELTLSLPRGRRWLR